MAPAQRIFQILIPSLVLRTSSLSSLSSRALRRPVLALVLTAMLVSMCLSRWRLTGRVSRRRSPAEEYPARVACRSP